MDRLLEKPRTSTSGVFRFLGVVLPLHIAIRCHACILQQQSNQKKSPLERLTKDLQLSYIYVYIMAGFSKIQQKVEFRPKSHCSIVGI